MVRLTRAVMALDQSLRNGSPPLDRARMLQLLDEIDAAASELDAEGRPTNHPMMSLGLAAFRSDVRAARVAAESDPPNEYLVGAVAGACGYCHQ